MYIVTWSAFNILNMRDMGAREAGKGQIKADNARRAKARAWEGSESAAVESEGNMSVNEVQMCRELFHFLIIPTASESDQTHARFTTESGESDHIPPRQNLGFSRSGYETKGLYTI